MCIGVAPRSPAIDQDPLVLRAVRTQNKMTVSALESCSPDYSQQVQSMVSKQFVTVFCMNINGAATKEFDSGFRAGYKTSCEHNLTS